jgi:two-component system cell cycle sensor histidine kinase/response regulator CckA
VIPRRTLPLRALLEEPGAAVALLDGSGRLLAASAAFQALTHQAPELAAITAAKPGAGFEARITTQTGPCPVAVSLARTGFTRPATVLRLTDLRPRDRLEAQLAQAQRLQTVGQMAAGIAHDFNNLLTATLGAAEALETSVGEAGQGDLAVIRASAERGAALVRHLLAFGGQQVLQPRALALNNAVADLAELLVPLLCPGITLHTKLDDPGRTIWIDPTQLDQVLVNLAANARDAMPNGGTLTITTGRRLVLAPEQENGHTLKPGRYVTLEVTDTGTGIPPEIQARIFEPFFTTRKSAGGTGLGLSTVQGIIRQSGGTLSLRTEAGRGTSFTITLPRYDALPAPMPQPAPLAVSGSRCVLLVDDEAPIRLLAARALTKAGWRVLQAPSAEDALEMDTACIDQVISDVSMPGMDGPTLVRTLRTRHPGLKALLISGYADAAQRQALLAERVKFLAKPFAMADLVRQVEESTSF